MNGINKKQVVYEGSNKLIKAFVDAGNEVARVFAEADKAQEVAIAKAEKEWQNTVDACRDEYTNKVMSIGDLGAITADELEEFLTFAVQDGHDAFERSGGAMPYEWGRMLLVRVAEDLGKYPNTMEEYEAVFRRKMDEHTQELKEEVAKVLGISPEDVDEMYEHLEHDLMRRRHR